MGFFQIPFCPALLIAFFFLFRLPVLAQTPEPAETPNPIEVHFATLSGIRYIQDNRLLSGRDVRAIIFPTGDPESIRLLKKSQSSGTLGMIGLGAGLGTMAGGIIAATNNTADSNNVLTGAGIALGGLCLAGVGALFNLEAKTTEFNAVQRFNRGAMEYDQKNQSVVQKPDGTTLELIEVRLTTLGGFGYSIQGRDLNHFEEIKERIVSINDFEASRMIKRSESSDLISKILIGLGIGGEIATIAANGGPSTNGERAGFWFPLIGCVLAAEAGSFFQLEANTAKFNAVKRYNRFARGQEQVLPQAPTDDKSLLNFNNTVETAPKK